VKSAGVLKIPLVVTIGGINPKDYLWYVAHVAKNQATNIKSAVSGMGDLREHFYPSGCLEQQKTGTLNTRKLVIRITINTQCPT